MWATQAQIDEDIQDEIQELKTAIKWAGDQLTNVQKTGGTEMRLEFYSILCYSCSIQS